MAVFPLKWRPNMNTHLRVPLSKVHPFVSVTKITLNLLLNRGGIE